MLFLLVVTIISLLLTVIMGVIAWRTMQEEKRRSNARVAVLAAEIHGGRPHAVTRAEPEFDLRRSSDPPVARSSSGLFETSTAPRTGPRLATVVAIGLLVCGSIAAVAVMLGTGSSAATHFASSVSTEQPAAAATHAAPESPVPLELLALGHERSGDRLAVRGVVRNPSVGREADRVTAVVFLYDRSGGFLTSGRAAIESTALAPGGESSFLVVVPGAS